ncbi:MAG: CPBP family glutamic-type intramembrane protease [Deinococcales bacterium]
MEIFLYRLKLAFNSFPSPQEWLLCLGIFFIYALITLVILWRSRVFSFALSPLSLRYLFLLAFIALISPSLLEETFYRVLLLPHPSEALIWWKVLGLTVLSLSLFILAHPLLAYSLLKSYRPIFYHKSFLHIVFWLGLACSSSYLLTGSFWPPFLIHWLTIVLWKTFFKGPDFGLGQ